METIAPFSNVGLDVFGPFYVHDGRKTRSSSGKKIWAVIFVCLPSRAIHLEPLTGMDVGSFRNALSRFEALRGSAVFLRSDQGTNFIAAKKQFDSLSVDEVFKDRRFPKWTMNPPGASHMGGAWERKIGSVRSVRRVLEASLALMSNRSLARITTSPTGQRCVRAVSRRVWIM